MVIEGLFFLDGVVVEKGFFGLGVLFQAFDRSVEVATHLWYKQNYVANSEQSQFFLKSQFLQVFVLYVLGTIAVPEDAVKKGRNVRQVFFMENASVLSGVFVIIVFVELQRLVPGDHNILRIYVNYVNGFGMFRVVRVSAELFHLVGSDMGYRQVFKYF